MIDLNKNKEIPIAEAKVDFKESTVTSSVPRMTAPKKKQEPKKEKPKKISIFDAIKANPRFSPARSVEWFKDRIRELKPNSPVHQSGLYDTNLNRISPRILPGTMIFYAYDPKYKLTLPYYDRFPLVFVMSIVKDRFIGLNFHYLTIPVRMKLYDEMYKIARMSHLPTQQVLALNYQLLSNVSKFPAVIPSIHSYLFSHVRSRYLKVEIDSWKSAILLENAEFKKMSAGNVRTISNQKIAAALGG